MNHRIFLRSCREVISLVIQSPELSKVRSLLESIKTDQIGRATHSSAYFHLSLCHEDDRLADISFFGNDASFFHVLVS